MNNYDQALRSKVIRDYIKKNNTSPSEARIRELLREIKKDNPNIEDYGLVNLGLSYPNFMSEFSSSEENSNREAIAIDINVQDSIIDKLYESICENRRSFNSSVNRLNRYIISLESKIDNLLILNSKSNIFLHGISESFDDYESINQELSTVSMEPGYVTLGRDNVSLYNLKNCSFNVYASGEKGFTSAIQNSSIGSIRKSDGNIWEYFVYTGYKTGKVSTIIELDFNEAVPFINEIRLTGNPINSNSRMTYFIMATKDGSTYFPVGNESYMVSGINTQIAGIEDVRKLKIVLIKNAADQITSNGQNKYIFSLDSIEVTTSEFSRNSESVLYAGPYYIYDEHNNPVNFSLASMEHGTCCIIPDKSSVSFFLSKDNENWIPASYDGKSFRVVQFASLSSESSYSYIDESSHPYSLINEVPDIVQLEYGKEILCNSYLSPSTSSDLIFRTVVIERNIPNGKRLYNTESGWFFDSTTKQYSTVIEVTEIEGRYIDLGIRSAYINGALMSGKISLPKGYHRFSTSHTNWYKVPEGINNADKLKEADPLYPFNHKLIVEGYNYPVTFSGNKVYNGVGRNFGALLEYVTPELFNSSENDNRLDIYTIEEYYGYLYFKVKIDPNDSSWSNEHIKVNYSLRTDTTNAIYVKAIIKSNDSKVSPHINTFQVRVI